MSYVDPTGIWELAPGITSYKSITTYDMNVVEIDVCDSVIEIKTHEYSETYHLSHTLNSLWVEWTITHGLVRYLHVRRNAYHKLYYVDNRFHGPRV